MQNSTIERLTFVVPASFTCKVNLTVLWVSVKITIPGEIFLKLFLTNVLKKGCWTKYSLQD